MVLSDSKDEKIQESNDAQIEQYESIYEMDNKIDSLTSQNDENQNYQFSFNNLDKKVS